MFLSVDAVALHVGVRDQFICELWIQGVEHIPEIFAILLATSCKFVGEVTFELGLVLEHGHDVLDAQFSVEGDVDESNILDLEKGLVVANYSLQKILVEAD